METFENSLPVGTVLDNRYKIEAILGEGGFGVTYKAHDSELDYTVVIKEFLPQECAARAGDSVTVQARTNRTDDYEYGLTRFIEEARTLAKFQHNNIVRVSNFVKSNGTAYFVMDYAEGEDLSDWLKKHEVLNEDIILKIVTPILEGLAEVHKTGLMHRDIKPGNIFMRKQGGPMLIDFGAARQALGEHSKSISAIISMGYAPPEQYSSHGKQGSYTDLYAVGAVLYKLITGNTPIESSVRSHAKAEDEADPLTPAIEAGQGKVADWLLQLTDQLLNISAKNRPQTAEAVLQAIQNKAAAVVGADSSAQPSSKQSDNKTRVVRSSERFAKKAKSQPEQSKNGAHGAPYGKIAAIVTLVGVIAGGGWWFTQSGADKNVRINSNLQTAQATQSKTLEKGNAILYVESEPSEAEIYLDGILLGQTPYKSETLPKGEHEIKLTHANAEDGISNITLKDNVIVKKAYKLDPASGTVSVFSTPEGASIFLDEKDTGKKTPATLEGVVTGDHQITLHKDTYYPKEIVVNVLKGKAIREDLNLEGGHLVEYKGEWLELEEKEKRITNAKEAKRIADAKEAKRIADVKEAKRIADAKEAKRIADAKDAKRLAKAKEAEQIVEQKTGKEQAAVYRRQARSLADKGELDKVKLLLAKAERLVKKSWTDKRILAEAEAANNLNKLKIIGGTKSDYDAQVKTNVETQAVINTVVGFITSHNYADFPTVVHLVEEATDHLGYAEEVKKQSSEFASNGDWSNATAFAGQWWQHLVKTADLGLQAKTYLEENGAIKSK